MFLATEIFFSVPPIILDRHYEIKPSTDHRAKFHAGQLTHLEDFAREKKLKIWSKAQRESARRSMSDWGKLVESKFSSASKSRGPYSNALAYAKRALST